VPRPGGPFVIGRDGSHDSPVEEHQLAYLHSHQFGERRIVPNQTDSRLEHAALRLLEIVRGHDDLGVGMRERPPDQQNGREKTLAALLHLAPHPQTIGPLEHVDEHAALVAAQPPGLALLVVRQKRVGEQDRVEPQSLERHPPSV